MSNSLVAIGASVSARLAAAVDPDDARDSAREILSDRRFRSDPAPRPLRGPVQWVGERATSIGNGISSVLGKVPWELWLGLAVLAVALLVALLVRSRGRRAIRDKKRADGVSVAPNAVDDPDALDREADAAEAAGDLDRAVRLRFRAGLLRLGRRGAIQYRSSVTTGEVRRTLRSNTFDDLALTFERVTYGGREASQPDVDTARREWPRVLTESAGR
jgi:hypothetical protein